MNKTIELTVNEQNFLPTFLDLVSKNDIVFAHIEDGSDEDLAVEGIMQKLSDAYKQLQHFKDTSVGLWATDRPNLIKCDKEILFELKY